ncbi:MULTISPECIES: hypothetical protein [Bacillaceae]|uniref:Uncharacterized protein n=1 Tax=Peribacillus huizhouensis TaxID=1501239 RepID=A0ABR6CJT9_9BACI|nr:MULTISPECIES: hypothetical protein [Bacillaceae]MBA9025285.1 hypothetical protein [Peribacillus huizhouensis]
MKQRYLFEYEVLSTQKKGEFSQVAETEEQAKTLIHERIVDLEFTEDEDVLIGKLLKVLDAEKQIFQCEGCES